MARAYKQTNKEMNGEKRTEATKQINIIGGATESSQHSFDEEEKTQFIYHINSALGEDIEMAGMIPISTEGNDLFEKTKNGIIMCKIINSAVPGTIDERVLKGKNKFEQIENNNLAINSAKAIGCRIINIDSNDLMEGKQHLVLGMLWQIIKRGLLSKISLRHHPELTRILNPDENLEDLLSLAPDEVLIRWFNYHLQNSGCNRTIKNLSNDLKDSICYTHLLNQLCPQKCNLECLYDTELHSRAEKMLVNADKIECKKYLTANAVVEGNPRLNLAFTANLFNKYPGLQPLSVDETTKIDETLAQYGREERTMLNWLRNVTMQELGGFEDLKDGLVLLKALDMISLGTVEWKRVNGIRPMSRFKAIENTNYLVGLCKEKGFSVVGIQGSDITDGNRTFTLSIIWQLMKLHLFLTLTRLSKTNRPIKEDDLLQWANDRLGGKNKINSFKDSSLRTSKPFLDLIDCIFPSVVCHALVLEGGTDEECQRNAVYAITCGRKIGALLFLLPEDITELNTKMILTLIASLMEIDMKRESKTSNY